MKAAVCTSYGPPEVLSIREVARPVPGKGEVLIETQASTVNSSDWFIRSGLPDAPLATRTMMKLLIGIRRPRKRILGLVLAGVVVGTGEAVDRFNVGDRVYAFTKFELGAYAQFTCLSQDATISRAPSNLTAEEAAAIPYGGLLALHFLRKGGLSSRDRVLVYGASGAVGTSAIQIAKHFDTDVTAVCGTSNLGLVCSLGADRAIDYTTTDRPEGRYDLVFDAVGRRKSSPFKEASRNALTPSGRFLSVDDGSPDLPAEDLATLTGLVEAGELVPVIDRIYPLDDIAEAHRYVEQEHKRGNVVISISHEAGASGPEF